LVSTCRQFAIPHVVLPKFQQAVITKMFSVKRITCFAINKSEWDEEEDFVMKFDQFNNAKMLADLEKYKFAQDQMFKPCQIKKWFVIKNLSAKEIFANQ